MQKGYPTHTTDVNGEIIRLGDIVGYNNEGNTSFFEVVFLENAFRKRYLDWGDDIMPNVLECGNSAKKMGYLIHKK
jgi:hypothetical protein